MYFVLWNVQICTLYSLQYCSICGQVNCLRNFSHTLSTLILSYILVFRCSKDKSATQRSLFIAVQCAKESTEERRKELQRQFCDVLGILSRIPYTVFHSQNWRLFVYFIFLKSDCVYFEMWRCLFREYINSVNSKQPSLEDLGCLMLTRGLWMLRCILVFDRR